MNTLITLMALATTTLAPNISFTTDSVYTSQNVISYSIVEEADASKTLILTEGNLLGYCIYDTPETPYIDGLKVDDQFVTDWRVPNYDDTVEHSILVKTVYTDDIAGTFAAAKDGDFSKFLENPITIFQIMYYVILIISVIAGGFGIYKTKKLKVKDHNQIASSVSTAAKSSIKGIEDVANEMISAMLIPTVEQLQIQNNAILEALILNRSTDADSQIALVELLKKATSSETLQKLAETIQHSIKETAAKHIEEKTTALSEVQKVVEETSTSAETEAIPTTDKDKYGGIAV